MDISLLFFFFFFFFGGGGGGGVLGHVSEGTPRKDPRTPVGNTGHPVQCCLQVSMPQPRMSD